MVATRRRKGGVFPKTDVREGSRARRDEGPSVRQVGHARRTRSPSCRAHWPSGPRCAEGRVRGRTDVTCRAREGVRCGARGAAGGIPRTSGGRRRAPGFAGTRSRRDAAGTARGDAPAAADAPRAHAAGPAGRQRRPPREAWLRSTTGGAGLPVQLPLARWRVPADGGGRAASALQSLVAEVDTRYSQIVRRNASSACEQARGRTLLRAAGRGKRSRRVDPPELTRAAG
jgi:hypothetical protein